ALVIAPKRVAEEVWSVERDLWRPDLSITVAKGSPAARAELLRSEADVTVLGRDNASDVLPLLAANRHTPFKTIIIDELSGYKARGTQRWKTMKKITMDADVDYVWGLPGTPSPN